MSEKTFLTCSVGSKVWSDTGTSAAVGMQMRWLLELLRKNKQNYVNITQACYRAVTWHSVWTRSVCEKGAVEGHWCVCMWHVPAVHMVNTTWTESKKKNMTSRDTEAPMGRNSACVESMVWIPVQTHILIRGFRFCSEEHTNILLQQHTISHNAHSFHF